MRVKKNRYTVAYRREREGRTDYKLRLKLLKSRKPRLVIRVTSTGIIVQVVEYHPDGDRVRVTMHSKALRKHGWEHATKNLPAAYLAGYAAGVRARKLGVHEAIVDLGLQHAHPKGRLFAAVKGALDAGLDIPHNPSVLPDEDRLMGKHMGDALPSMVERVKTSLEENA